MGGTISTSDARLLLLPGLGADHRLFALQQAVFPNLQVPPWLPPERDESLAHYAQRMAATVNLRPPLYLGGASFGGMVALEMARILRPEAVFLIGSCRSGRHIPRYLQWLEHRTRILPDGLVDAARLLSPLVSGKFARIDGPQRELLLDMFRGTPTSFIRWSCHAIAEWSAEDDLGFPVHHIHGADDRLIPARRVRADRLLPDCGHIPNLTHSAEVNAFLLEYIARGERTARMPQ